MAIAATGAATRLLGRMLAPDDHLSARAVLSGRREARGHAAAAPLYRGEPTIGAIEITISPRHAPLTARDLDRLTRAADAISAARMTMAAGSAHDASLEIPGYVLYRAERAIGWLEWRARTREKPGWYLARGIRPARRLPIDIGLDELADPSPPDRQDWEQRTHAAAALSTPLALDAADRALLGSRPPAPRGSFEPGAYELQVTGLNAVTAALSCPSMRVTGAGQTSIIAGVFDSDAMQTVIRRLDLLGAHVLAISRDH